MGLAYVTVARQRLAHQPVEQGIVVQLPPAVRERRLFDFSIAERIEWRLRCSLAHHGLVRYAVVRADRTASGEQRDEQGQGGYR